MDAGLNGRRGKAARWIMETLRVLGIGADKGRAIRVWEYDAGCRGTYGVGALHQAGPRSCNMTLRPGAQSLVD